jgi:predicted O-linked N-acetylglucosamine transferase (SPINDLY family)
MTSISADLLRQARILFEQGNRLLMERRFGEAAEQYRQALHLRADYWQAHVNLGLALRSDGDYQEARRHFETALRYKPDSVPALGYLFDAVLAAGDIRAIQAMRPTVDTVFRRCVTENNVQDYSALIYLGMLLGANRSERLTLSKKMNAIFPSRNNVPAHSPSLTGPKLRIGYLSPDFGDHPVSHVMLGIFGAHDRERFEIIAYSLTNRTRPADVAYSDFIRRSCDAYIDISGLTIEQAAKRIAADGIAILVNLAGYMSPPGLAVCALRPAPIQVFWLGHAGGLGLTFIDYVIADHVVIVPGEERDYTEAIVRLPECFHCADTPPISEQQPSRAENGLDPDAFIFCAFNNPIKIDTEVFTAWMNILRRVPGSQLWLSNPNGHNGMPDNLRAEAQRHGIASNRLVFADRLTDKALHLARHQLADLFLDTFTYTAATTALDALWTGLPVLTRKGEEYSSRICSSMLENVGLSELVCGTTTDFENYAVKLATSPAKLAAIRNLLARNRMTEPLFDIRRFARHLENAFETMATRARSGIAPANFDVRKLLR